MFDVSVCEVYTEICRVFRGMKLFINKCDLQTGNHKQEFFLFSVFSVLQVKSLLAVPH